MSSSWGTKLQGKLAALSESSSDDSLQALAKWIGFNRKHAAVFAATLQQAVLDCEQGALQNVHLQVIHHVMTLEHGGGDSNKWERLLDLRTALAEDALVPILQAAVPPAAWTETLPPLLKEWDKMNAFGVPTLIIQMRKLVSAKSSSPVKATKAAPAVSATAPKLQPVALLAPDKEPADQEESNQAVAPSTPQQDIDAKDILLEPTATTSIVPSVAAEQPLPFSQVEFDFEATGIASKTVKPAEFLEPCRSLATLQIARDLRNDGAVNLSSLLSSMPEAVRAECAAAASDEYGELDDADKAADFSTLVHESLIDMDVQDQLQNIINFRDIVQRQHAARKKLIHLLVQSRCSFGADDAAAAFLTTAALQETLVDRKQILMDALELEGLDVEQEKVEPVEQELAPLSWYTGDVAKRQRTE